MPRYLRMKNKDFNKMLKLAEDGMALNNQEKADLLQNAVDAAVELKKNEDRCLRLFKRNCRRDEDGFCAYCFACMQV